MVHAIREFFEKHIRSAGPGCAETRRDPLHVATAALLLEVMRMDGTATENEQYRVTRILETKFALPPEQTAELLQLAETQARQATDYYQFTALINHRLSALEKERLVEHLWSVAYADGELHRYEEHLVRKIANLLHVSHDSFIAAKQRARESR